MITPRSGVRLYLSTIIPFCAIVANWRHPLFSSSEPISGACVEVAVWFLPWFALVGVSLNAHVAQRFLGALSLAPLLRFSLIAIPWSTGDVGTAVHYGKNLEFAPIARTDVPDGSQLVTHQSDCGFVCGPVAVLRHERTIFGPLSIVRLIAAKDGETICAHLADDRHVAVEGKLFALRSYIVF